MSRNANTSVQSAAAGERGAHVAPEQGASTKRAAGETVGKLGTHQWSEPELPHCRGPKEMCNSALYGDFLRTLGA
jgi:hypothetical protein